MFLMEVQLGSVKPCNPEVNTNISGKSRGPQYDGWK